MRIEAYTGNHDYAAGLVLTGMPEQAYHSHESISKSGLDLVNKSPAHYHNAPPREATRTMEIGSATHAALLEPERFEQEWVIVDVKDKRQKEWKAAVAEFGSDRVLTESECADIRSMQNAIRASHEACQLIDRATHFEASAFAEDPDTGVLVRCRYDLIGPGLVDLKTSKDARYDPFSRSVWDYRYHVQAALYSDIWSWLTGDHEPFQFIAVEPGFPHTVAVYTLDDDALEQGRREYRSNLNTYALCLESGHWPKYEPEYNVLSLPGWVMNQIENELEVVL